MNSRISSIRNDPARPTQLREGQGTHPSAHAERDDHVFQIVAEGWIHGISISRGVHCQQNSSWPSHFLFLFGAWTFDGFPSLSRQTTSSGRALPHPARVPSRLNRETRRRRDT